jgi:hypothetical protein
MYHKRGFGRLDHLSLKFTNRGGKHIITNQFFLSVHRKMILRSLEFMVFATYLARSLGSYQLPFRIAHEAVAQKGWNGVWTWI